MGVNKQTVADRKKYLIEVDGYLYNPEAPTDAHGRSIGYMIWSCRCTPCRTWNLKRARGPAVRGAAAGLDPEDRSQRVALSFMVSLAEFDQIRLNARRAGKSVADFVIASAYHHKSSDEPIEPESPLVEPTPIEPAREPVHKPTVKPVAKPVAVTVPEEPKPVPPIPPMTSSIREMIGDVEDLRELSETYYEPDWSAPTGFEDRERRARGSQEIIVAGDQKIIYWRRDREQATGESELLTTKPKSLPKAKGGGNGSATHTTTKALIEALKAAGAEVTIGGSGHYIVKKDGKTTVIPMTPSDHRSLKNSNAEVRRAGMLSKG